jgi:predicted enzyme related to lactoylglutathione lyase
MLRSSLAILCGVMCLVSLGQSAEQTQPATTSQPLVLPRVPLVRVFVADLDKSENFYRTVFGLAAAEHHGERERVFVMPDPTSARIVLNMADKPRGNGSFALAITDVDAAMRRAVALGGKIERPAQSVPALKVTIGIINDLDGAQIELIQPPANTGH